MTDQLENYAVMSDELEKLLYSAIVIECHVEYENGFLTLYPKSTEPRSGKPSSGSTTRLIPDMVLAMRGIPSTGS